MVRCMHRTNIFLEERQTAALDELAREGGVSRAAVIRRLIDQALAGATDSTAADLVTIQLTFDTARMDDSFDRAPDARAAHLESLWARQA